MNIHKRLGEANKTLIALGAIVLFLTISRPNAVMAAQASPMSFEAPVQAVTLAYTSTTAKVSQAIQKSNKLGVLGFGFFAVHSLVFEHLLNGKKWSADLKTPVETRESAHPPVERDRRSESTEMKDFFETSERFLGNTGGISPVKESEPLKVTPVKVIEPKVEPKKVPLPARVIKAEKLEKNVYEREKCDEIPYGWTCSSFYPGGAKKTTVNKQHYQDGDSEKGSAWMSEHRLEWDKNGVVVKNEVLKTQSEWQHDELKDYFYSQTYKNGVLIHEKYEDKLTNPAHKAEGLIVEAGRL